MGTDVREIPISQISIGKRHRHDVGDLAELRRSIDAVGLLHPVVLSPEMKLVAGARRVAAFKQMGRKSIPAVIVASLNDALAALKAERDENVCRKDFTPSEAVALGMELENLERPKAKERQQARKGNQPGDKSVIFTDLGSVRDKVSAAVGLSGPSYDRAKKVVQAAAEHPEKYAAVVAEMDRTGKVTPAYERVTGKDTNAGKHKAKKKNGPRFDDGFYGSLCDQLESWITRRFDKAGGAEARDECLSLVGQLSRRISQWQKQKPIA